VRTSFGPVLLQGVEGSIDVVNKNGSVQVSHLAGKCVPISLRTSFAPIRVALGESASYRVDARTSFGRVSSDIPLLTQASGDDGSLNGRIGGGDCPMSLANSNGNIEIGRSQ
jgi:DUF4097 and DUF4098 domain-containing protein YvlB